VTDICAHYKFMYVKVNIIKRIQTLWNIEFYQKHTRNGVMKYSCKLAAAFSTTLLPSVLLVGWLVDRTGIRPIKPFFQNPLGFQLMKLGGVQHKVPCSGTKQS